MDFTEFETKDGLCQGGALSSSLFVICINEIIKRCSAITRKVQIGHLNIERAQLSKCAFANDIVITITASSETSLQESITIWNPVLKEADI